VVKRTNANPFGHPGEHNERMPALPSWAEYGGAIAWAAANTIVAKANFIRLKVTNVLLFFAGHPRRKF
jgi:hypothetical protein